MSAKQLDDDGDEDVRRAQRANEPSMEEILASIRAIIADDKTVAASRTAAVSARPAPAPATASGGSQVIYSAFGQRPAETPQPTVVWSRTEDQPQPVEDLDDYQPEPEPEAPLMAAETDREVAASFHALSASLAMPDPQKVEEMTRELLRPMLKAWLDDNLPGLVERLVKAEIQRVVRGVR